MRLDLTGTLDELEPLLRERGFVALRMSNGPVDLADADPYGMRRIGSPNIHGEKDAHFIWRAQLWQHKDGTFALTDEREASPGFLNGFFPLLTERQRTHYANFDKFRTELEAAYRDLFANDPEYAYSASKTTPGILASKMAEELMAGSAHHVGEGIKRACRACGIKHTAKAIREYLNVGSRF